MNKLYKNGLTIGKFMPPHKGHELMIQFGSNMCENMHVLVSGKGEDNPSPIERATWLRKTFPCVKIRWEWDTIPKPLYDDEGVAIQDWFWRDWVTNIHAKFPKIDAVFSNDAYGKRLAKELNAVWVPIDPKRVMINISATQIRKDLQYNFEFLNKYAKEFYQKKVAIVGPESTGKSTLTQYLANVFNAAAIPEYGRVISEIRNNILTEDDFSTILTGHNTLVESVEAPLVFVDTESVTTRLFADHYLNGDYSSKLEREFDVQHMKDDYDLYLLLAPTVPWVGDGERIISSASKRNTFYEALKNYLSINNKNYAVISDPSFEMRRVFAKQAVKEKLRNG